MATYLPHFMLFLAAVSTTHGNPSAPYEPECEPPPSITVPPPVGNSSTTTTEYAQMAPIERCCPQCSDCAEISGICMIKWVSEMMPQWCDFETTTECKNYGCRCCIKCGDDTCSPCVQTGGECRSDCRADELSDTENQCSFHNNGTGCKCCKKCEATSECTDAHGRCVTNPNDCPVGTFASTGCCGGCYCCKPVLTESSPGGCSDGGSYCSEDQVCASGFYANFGGCHKTLTIAGLETTELGYCCVAKATAIGTGRRDMMYQNLNLAAAAHNPEMQPFGRRRHPLYLED